MEITEGNKLIAEFLGGYKTEGVEGWNFTNVKDFIVTGTDDESLSFHESWDWLMPVVEKIRTLKDDVPDTQAGLAYSTVTTHIEANGNRFAGKERNYRVMLLGTLVYKKPINSYQHTYDKVEVPSITRYGESGLIALFEVVVEFIKWYNSLNPASVNTINK